MNEITTNIKVLICDNTAEFGVKTASELRSSGLYAYTRKRDGRTVLNSIVNDKPDVVVSELTVGDIDAIVMMKNAAALAKERPAYIIISDIKNSFIERQALEAGASYVLTRPFENDTLCSVIKSVVRKEPLPGCRDIELLVTDAIHKMGVPAHIKGYHYLRNAIIDAVEEPKVMDSITKLLYPKVARSFNTTPSRVERAIRHAIDIAWNRNGGDTMDTLFGFSGTFYERPTNSEFIALMADRLRLNMKNPSRDYALF